jgi:hypothetical protein
MEKSSQTAWKLVPLRHFFALKNVPLIDVLLYSRVHLTTYNLTTQQILRPYPVKPNGIVFSKGGWGGGVQRLSMYMIHGSCKLLLYLGFRHLPRAHSLRSDHLPCRYPMLLPWVEVLSFPRKKRRTWCLCVGERGGGG